MRTCALAMLALMMPACLNPVQRVSSYKTSCTIDSDCDSVFEGDVCKEICFCPNAAVAVSDLARYRSDQQALLANCGPRPAIACAADCIGPVHHCLGNVCHFP